MLDAQTKSKIDSARDILVGKVPDPKSQVEQITIALIYKFMDDMDRQSEELGGKATFFAGDFKKYRWAQLLDKRLGGHERLLLYAEGIEKMNVNKNIPQLFRDIFKGVFLPYRDPETLNLFLKEVNGFTYEHSERLGDAYEYLLSVLGTQGDAGQFRTPRHIIDFIVAVVDPKKNETVLDPACGTAGFLISAFKHIERNNENLTPDERARLMTNFRGYDIAPDMVRLSRANMYLHGFAQPSIHEYDTLTSEERWDERCDVIMANPPFMSPKGGIRPHNRFSIKAKRSEVLFVDYMAEHLNPSGRAGIIVPEGIIFQSQNAYKALRKMLIENYLWAVVSLPAGVFNPYSGVKTSILFLDRNLARRTDDLLFVKVESDGFDLGAQRRPIEKNDLPEALNILESYKKTQKIQERKMALTVSRKRLLKSGDINLSGDRYRVAAARLNGKWPMVKLGEVADVIAGQSPEGKHYNDIGNGTPFYQGKTEFGEMYIGEPKIWTTQITKLAEPGDILMSVRAPVGPVNLATQGICIGRGLAAIREKKIHQMFLFYNLKSMQGKIKGSGGAVFDSISKTQIEEIQIPLPPLEIQQQIVAELDGYRKVIEGARQVIANYKPTIRIDPEWPRVKLGEVCRQERRIASLKAELQLPYLGLEDIESGTGRIHPNIFTNEAISTSFTFGPSHVLYSKLRPYLNKVALPDFEGRCTTELIPILPSDRIQRTYLFWLLLRQETVTVAMDGKTGTRMPRADMELIMNMEIPLPPLAIQREIVAEIKAERALVEANRKLAEIFEAKIKAKLDEIWGEE